MYTMGKTIRKKVLQKKIKSNRSNRSNHLKRTRGRQYRGGTSLRPGDIKHAKWMKKSASKSRIRPIKRGVPVSMLPDAAWVDGPITRWKGPIKSKSNSQSKSKSKEPTVWCNWLGGSSNNPCKELIPRSKLAHHLREVHGVESKPAKRVYFKIGDKGHETLQAWVG